jgi:hypothetical protein
MMGSTLQWKAHIDLLSMKLNAAGYALRTLKHTMSQQILVMVYFSYFHSIMSYGKIFWGASPHRTNIFKLEKKKNIYIYIYIEELLQILEKWKHVGSCLLNLRS